MPKRKLCITLDLEADYAGLVQGESYQAAQEALTEQWLAVVKHHSLKLTVFVVGRMLEQRLPIVQKLAKLGAEFELHSYSHDVTNPTGVEELVAGRRVFKKYFGRYPIGYRAPQGRIDKAGLERLAAHGFRYDSSVFRSWWPSPGYFGWPKKIHKQGQIWELPVSTLGYGVVASQSWLKLIGWEGWHKLLAARDLGGVCIFDCHLHDYGRGVGFEKLDWKWQWLMRRNEKRSVTYFENFIRYMQSTGYTSAYLRELT